MIACSAVMEADRELPGVLIRPPMAVSGKIEVLWWPLIDSVGIGLAVSCMQASRMLSGPLSNPAQGPSRSVRDRSSQLVSVHALGPSFFRLATNQSEYFACAVVVARVDGPEGTGRVS